MQPSYKLRTICILILLNLCLLLLGKEKLAAAPLHGGCITTPTQYVLTGTVAATINATTASGCAIPGNYQYQWQSSTDNIRFTDIPGATSQNLVFTTPLAQTTWFHRKTICGTEVAFTNNTVSVIMAAVFYYNRGKSTLFYRNDCGEGITGSPVYYTVPYQKYVSPINQAVVDSMEEADIAANGQNYANTNGNCTNLTIVVIYTPPTPNFTVVIKNAAGATIFGRSLYAADLPISMTMAIPAGCTLEMTAGATIWARVNGVQKSVLSKTSWPVAGRVYVEVSQNHIPEF